MPNTLIMEPANDADLALLLHLAQRLGVKATATPAPPAKPDVTGRAQLFRSLFGAWQSEESGEELNSQLREARQSTRPDLEL